VAGAERAGWWLVSTAAAVGRAVVGLAAEWK
jgi:hypothetical protein